MTNVAVRCGSGEARLQCLHSLQLPLTELKRDKRSIRNLWLRLFMLLKGVKSVFKLWNVL